MLGIIGGTGFTSLAGFEVEEARQIDTPFGSPSADVLLGKIAGHTVAFLARHGQPHCIPPHMINYRANIWALRDAGVQQIIAVAAVGGITPDAHPRAVVIPDQLIDYSYGRQHTFFEEHLEHVTHIDFTNPYSERVRSLLLQAAAGVALNVVDGGVYGCTQGPRLESSAEIRRLERDGCSIVGMTGMPEASLARELDLDYACCAVVANWGAGKQLGIISMEEIENNLKAGMDDVVALVRNAVVLATAK